MTPATTTTTTTAANSTDAAFITNMLVWVVGFLVGMSTALVLMAYHLHRLGV